MAENSTSKPVADPTGIETEVIDLDAVNLTDSEFSDNRFDLHWLAKQVKERDAQLQTEA